MLEEITYWDAKKIAFSYHSGFTTAQEYLNAFDFCDQEKGRSSTILSISKIDGSIRFYLTGNGYQIQNDTTVFKPDITLNYIEIREDGDIFKPGYYSYYPGIKAVGRGGCFYCSKYNGWVMDLDYVYGDEYENCRNITPREAYKIITSKEYCFEY